MTSTPTTSVLEDEYYGENGALSKVDDVTPFIELATLMDELSREGRINDMRRELIKSFINMRESYGNHRELEGRLEENDSLLDVAEHEIKTGQWCLNHDKYVSQCAACRRRFMFYTVCDELKLVISERKAELESQKENTK